MAFEVKGPVEIQLMTVINDFVVIWIMNFKQMFS